MIQNEFHKQAVELMKKIWQFYLVSHSKEDIAYIFDHLADDFVIIGTGKHEIFSGIDQIKQALAIDQKEIGEAKFDIMDEWYEIQPLSEQLCFVYGGFCAREINRCNMHHLTDMDTRFTAVCRYVNDTVILCNLHHSVPNMDQDIGEFYPKTIAQKANDAIQHSLFLEQQLKLDSLTGLYNRAATEEYINNALFDSESESAFLMIDIDDFKTINDTYGHLQGDLFLRSFAELMKATFTQVELISRLGGDEFCVFIQHNTSKGNAEKLAQQLLDNLNSHIQLPFGCTIGIAYSDSLVCDFIKLYNKADNALYHSKNTAKGSYSIYK